MEGLFAATSEHLGVLGEVAHDPAQDECRRSRPADEKAAAKGPGTQ